MNHVKYFTIFTLIIFILLTCGCSSIGLPFQYQSVNIKNLQENPKDYYCKTVSLQGIVVKTELTPSKEFKLDGHYVLNDSTGEISIPVAIYKKSFNYNKTRYPNMEYLTNNMIDLPKVGTKIKVTGKYIGVVHMGVSRGPYGVGYVSTFEGIEYTFHEEKREIIGPLSNEPAEVQSYNGEVLSSVNDIRENSIMGPQHINITNYHLTVTGLTKKTDVYTYNEVLKNYPHYSKVSTIFSDEGWYATILWEGVLVRDLIVEAGIDPRANTVIFTGHDGYTTSLPLEYLMNNDIIIAYKMNNAVMPPERGYPFTLVADGKWEYKWIRWIEKIELSDDPSYKGYWEVRGFSNTGNLEDKPY